MPVRTNGGVFDQQVLTGSLGHYVICGANFSGAINPSTLQPIPGSAAEIICTNIAESAYIEIVNPNEYNMSFALDERRSAWDEISLTEMVQSLGTNVGIDNVDCAVCTVKRVPYIWGCGLASESFLQLTDTPKSYAGYAGYIVTVNPGETGLIFTPAPAGTFSYDFVAVPGQPTLSAVTSSTLTINPGVDVSISTDFAANSVTINSTAGTDYIPVPAGTTLNFSFRYYVTGPFPVAPAALAYVTLPLGTGSGKPAGTSVRIAKPADGLGLISLLVNTQGADIINTDIGTTNSVEFDATQEIILVFDGTSTWQLQIGSVNV